MAKITRKHIEAMRRGEPIPDERTPEEREVDERAAARERATSEVARVAGEFGRQLGRRLAKK